MLAALDRVTAVPDISQEFAKSSDPIVSPEQQQQYLPHTTLQQQQQQEQQHQM